MSREATWSKSSRKRPSAKASALWRSDGANGVYRYGSSGFPTDSYGSTNYWVDPVFSTVPPVDTTPPTVTAVSPAPGATRVALSPTVTATFSEAVTNAVSMTLKDPLGLTVPATVSYHTPCHLKAQNVGLKSRDLIKLTGARVTLVQQCSGIDGMWGLKAANAGISIPIAQKLGEALRRADSEVIAGDCHLANTAIREQTGRTPLHPLQLIARAYGIAPEVTP